MLQPSPILLLLFSPLLSSLRFGTFQTDPFTMRKKECLIDDGKKECAGNNAYEGFCVDLMKEMAKEMDVEYKIEIRSGAGSLRPNGEWDGLIGDLNESLVDIAIAPIPITPDRQEIVDFSPSFYTSGVSLMIKKPGPNGIIRSLNPFALVSWIALFFLEIMSMFTYVCLYCHVRMDTSDRKGVWRYYILLFFLITWIFWNAALIVTIIYHICTTAAANSRAEPIQYFESIEEVANQDEIKYGIQRGGMAHDFFKTSNDSLYQMMMETMEENGDESFVHYYNHGIARVRGDPMEEGRFVFILDDAANDHENSKLPCDTRKIGNKLLPYEFAVATKKGSDLSEKVYAAIDSLKKAGNIEKIRKYWFEERVHCGDSTMALEMSAAERNVTYIIYGMIGGIISSILIAILLYHIEKKRLERPAKYTDEVTPMNA